MDHRRQRLGDVIREEIARLLREEVRDPRIGFVTLTDVEMSPDLRHARVFVSILDADGPASLAALQHAAPFLRRALAHRAGLRFTPELRFVIDESIDGGFRVDKLLEEVRASDEESADDETGDEGTSD